LFGATVVDGIDTQKADESLPNNGLPASGCNDARRVLGAVDGNSLASAKAE
jgi:hypothetical protein